MLALTSTNVILPGYDVPQTATIEIDQITGKITNVTIGKARRRSYGEMTDDSFIDYGDLYLMPGLVE